MTPPELDDDHVAVICRVLVAHGVQFVVIGGVAARLHETGYATVDSAALVGFSQGGFLGLRLALRYPERVKGLVLADTGPHAFSAEVISLYQALFDQALHTGIDDAMSDTFVGILFARGVDADRWIAKWRARPVAGVAAAEECLVSRDEIGDRMSEIDCPVLVIHGELDAPFPIGEVDEWATRLPHLDTVVRVAGAGHSAMIENPDAVVPSLRRFLRALV